MARKTEVAPQLLAADRTRIGEIMSRGVITVPVDLGLEQLVEVLLEQGLSRVPVVDDQGRAIGMISKTDLVIDQHQRGDTEVSQLAGGRGRHVEEVGRLVRDIMTPVAFTLPATASIGEAARRMLADNVHAVPVTSEQGEVIGLLSATDIIAWVAGADFETEAANAAT